MNISKLMKAVKQLDIFLYFGMGLVMIQALAITGGFTFDSIVPYIVLLTVISFWQEKPAIEKRMVYLSTIFAFIFLIIYLWGENDLVKGIIVFTGGFLSVCCFYCRIKEFRVNMQAVIGTSLLVIIIFLNLIQEEFIVVAWQQPSGMISLTLILGVLYMGLYNTIYKIIQNRKISGYSLAGAFLFAVFAILGHITAFEGRLVDYKITSSFSVSVVTALICWISLFYLSYEEFYNIISRISFKRTEGNGGVPRPSFLDRVRFIFGYYYELSSIFLKILSGNNRIRFMDADGTGSGSAVQQSPSLAPYDYHQSDI